MIEDGNKDGLGQDLSDKGRRRQSRIRIRTPKLNEIAGLLASVGACLYFFNRLRAEDFLGRFGLGPGVIPVASQDAVADGTKALVVNVLSFWGPICTIAVFWVFLDTLLRITGWDRLRLRRRAAPRSRFISKGLRRLRADPYAEVKYTVLILIVVSPLAILVGAILIAFPAATSARRDVQNSYDRLTHGCKACSVYEMRGGSSLKGLLIGNTPDRLFILSTDCSVRPVRIDDIETILPVDLNAPNQAVSPSRSKPVSCRGRTD